MVPRQNQHRVPREGCIFQARRAMAETRKMQTDALGPTSSLLEGDVGFPGHGVRSPPPGYNNLLHGAQLRPVSAP